MGDTKRAGRGQARTFFDQAIQLDTDECIDWPYGTDSHGYGKLKVGGRRVNAATLACELVHGPRPRGTECAHSCRQNRRCINPRHLRWATHLENEADKKAHGTLPRGERSPVAKLTQLEVDEIRRRRALGVPVRILCVEFGISRANTYRIINGERWPSGD